MIDWDSGHYCGESDAWRFNDGQIEVLVAGTVALPDPFWLSVAEEFLSGSDRQCDAAGEYLDSFVDRTRFAADASWELERIEFGLSRESPNPRFVIFLRIHGDQYGLWSVVYHGTGLPSPHDVYPSRFQRRQA